MNPILLTALAPVILLVAVGWFAGRRGWIGAGSVRDLSNLVFYVMAPAMLFRALATSHLGDFDLRSIGAYFAAAILLFFGVVFTRGRDRRATVLGLAAVFSNTLMIGLPLVTLAFGQAGSVLLMALISLHAIVLLVLATLVLEFMVIREQARAGQPSPRNVAQTVLLVLRNAIIHPIPLPIIAGMLYSLTGWGLAPLVDQTLALVGSAFAPLALLLVGVTLAHNPVGAQLREALGLSVLKCFVHPLLMFAIGWALGLRGMALGVMTVTAALPMGANVFLFSQRYQVAEGVVTASVVVSSALSVVSVSLVLALLPLLN